MLEEVVVHRARQRYANIGLPWKEYREWLCPIPQLQGRPKEWMPWFPETRDITGYYMDESSQLFLQRVYDDLTFKSIDDNHVCTDETTTHSEEEMTLMFRAWFSYPRLLLNHGQIMAQTVTDDALARPAGGDDDEDEDTAPSPLPPAHGPLRLARRGYVDDQKRFIPRAFVAGASVLLPYIWLHLSDDGKSLTVRESTIVASDYRIALASAANGYSLSSIHLPVYRRFPRQLTFTSPPVKEKGVFFEGVDQSYALSGGAKALLATLIATESNMLRKEDNLDPVMSDGGSVRKVTVDFHIDLVVRFNDATGQFDGVTGTHATPQSLYYVLIEHLDRHCLYSFHADDFRSPDEATGLDLHYPHPLSVII